MSQKKVATPQNMHDAQQYMAAHTPASYTLVDVRQPEEYATGHLPGARLIPLGELAARLGELDRNKPALVYCRSGRRAEDARALLQRSGFREVHNIGGILDWRGPINQTERRA